MEQANKHTFVTELDCSEGLTWAVEEYELLCDIKALLNEYYPATFTAYGNALNISFSNGQKFCVTVKEKSLLKSKLTKDEFRFLLYLNNKDFT